MTLVRVGTGGGVESLPLKTFIVKELVSTSCAWADKAIENSRIAARKRITFYYNGSAVRVVVAVYTPAGTAALLPRPTLNCKVVVLPRADYCQSFVK